MAASNNKSMTPNFDNLEKAVKAYSDKKRAYEKSHTGRDEPSYERYKDEQSRVYRGK